MLQIMTFYLSANIHILDTLQINSIPPHNFDFVFGVSFLRISTFLLINFDF